MAVADRDPVHGGGDREAGGNERLAVEAAQDAEGLRLDLLLFAPADVGHDVVGHVHGSDSGVARARERLQRRHRDLAQAEGAVQGSKRHRQAHDAAVRVGDDVTAAGALALDRERVEVIGVDLRDQQRHVGIHPMVAGVGDDGVALAGQRGLHLAGDRGVEPGEEHLGAERALARRHPKGTDRLGGSPGQPPGAGLAVRLARRAVGGGQVDHLEPRVIGEELDEALAHRSRRPQDAHRNLHVA